MIELKNVCVDYKNDKAIRRVLDNVNLSIKKGEMLSIMGPSGSGKTTLLNILGAMDIPSAGSYMFNGAEITKYNSSELNKFRKENIAFIFQKFELIAGYTVYENIELPMRAKNISKKTRKERIFPVLEKLGISELKDKFPNKISGGEMQRCAIARAIVSDNDFILADEPTGSLDQKTGEDIMHILKKLNENGKTIVVVTHDQHVAEYGDRIISIHDGKIRH